MPRHLQAVPGTPEPACAPRVIRIDAYPDRQCTGKLTCSCPKCEREKHHLHSVGPRRTPPQPWETRPARRAA